MADECNSNSSLLMTTSSNSSNEVQPRKRYKQFLYKNSDENQVCKRTQQKYASFCKTQNWNVLFPNQGFPENSYLLQPNEYQDKLVPDEDFYDSPMHENVDMNSEMESCNITSQRKESDTAIPLTYFDDRDYNFKGTDNNNTESESVSSSLNNSIDSTESLDYSDIEDERSTFFLTK
ncbi:hypothetical protein TSAR_016290 [Trichomalopsis sarcophagae]|uniref:Uncharacterized protein n=1 Tax=Trichomalopsis sarcophagae TaxID=543379 RepID=A0A232EKF9_9HYME|nr:hypothetical protein TSAR_016290 [Trichomalopsis sarcophagae]